ncbi:hypothetical protein BKH41_08510 [Helicobacter sp. 12S02232-10]|uniref:ATPase, T2SS/T4P/T4SS family n=1 Tax=Helicobacter sp. 12S02232-10 TaxID=1476197 RepID=UPI000BA7B61D|nr:ATPase, T2SS/T4P/T4SS family [Helicobacter sp. 12S02232-10]PAF46741.1 hypothetical protein BKH41_08510 [Helicobacter sp. 12S02232-10]
MITKLLSEALKKFKPYLESGANEVLINREFEVVLDKQGVYEFHQDENFNKKFLESFCMELATSRGLRFNENNPSLSCEIPIDPNNQENYYGYRVQAIHQSILYDSDISICIRIPSKTIFKLSDFALKADSSYEFIESLIRGKKNILVSGGTGTGKTSFLNALMTQVPIIDRIVTIEDSQELRIANPNKVQMLISKNENKFSYENALNASMRLRPDRIFLGEIDTRNCLLFLRLSNTGHDGMLSTLHANNTKDAIKAIMTNAMFGGFNDKEALKSYIRTAIDYIIQIKREKNQRVISEVFDVKNSIQDDFE